VAERPVEEGEARPSSTRVVMISEGLWKRRSGKAPAVIGRSLNLNGIDRSVVGVAPAALSVITTGDVWVPLVIDPAQEKRLNHVLTTIARLRPGVTLEQAP